MTKALARTAVAAAGGLALAAALACGGGGDQTAKAPEAPARPEPRAVPHAAIQLAAFTDSLAAARLRDSLDRAGWSAYLRRSTVSGRRLWRVRALPTTAPAVSRVAAITLARQIAGASVVAVRDTGVIGTPRVMEMFRVNTGSPGMFRRARWALSPDRRRIVVVEDPAGVESEPVPNGFVFGTEDGMRRVQMDSVWDVAPSPDWRRAAFGRAYVTFAREGDSLSDAAWQAFARRAGLTLAQARAGAFAASAMSIAFGLARPGVVDLESGGQRLLPVAGGWRVRWSEDGSRVMVGTGPSMVGDDAQPDEWFALDPAGERVARLPVPAKLADATWTEGPTLDVSIPASSGERVSLPIEGGQVESSNGWIRVLGRVVAPGTALVATRSGRFVAALVPDPDAGEFDAKEMLVVYIVAR